MRGEPLRRSGILARASANAYGACDLRMTGATAGFGTDAGSTADSMIAHFWAAVSEGHRFTMNAKSGSDRSAPFSAPPMFWTGVSTGVSCKDSAPAASTSLPSSPLHSAAVTLGRGRLIVRGSPPILDANAAYVRLQPAFGCGCITAAPADAAIRCRAAAIADPATCSIARSNRTLCPEASGTTRPCDSSYDRGFG